MTARRVLFLAYYFPPMAGPAAQRALKLVKYLPRSGWRPVVVTVEDDPFEPVDASRMGELAGVEVHRTAPHVLPRWAMGRRGLRLALNRLLAPEFQVGWLPRLRRTVDALLRAQRFDAVFTTCGPYALTLEGRRLRARFGLPWVMDFRDAWTLGAAFRPLTPLHRRLNERWEARACDACDYFIANTDRLLAEQRAKYPGLVPKSDCVPNGFDPDEFPRGRRPAGAGGRWRLLYVGSWYRRLYPDALFRILAAHHRRSGEAFEIHYVGSHGRVFGEEARRHGLGPLVVDHGFLSHADTVRWMRESHLGLLALPDDARARCWIPAKLYEYMAAGLPVFAVCPEGDAAALARAHGRAVDVGRPAALSEGADHLEALRRAWSTGGAAEPPAVPDRFQYPALAARLAGILDRVAGKIPPGG